ncbi:transposase [Pseudarthrobacter sulfonivorans]|uniref:transposase n=1 Tax=Pseudarthrobacter sulfonivorans TaxID=121292 RepID=UPI00285AD1B1|nr:transposase [Pseudarthrobacter sulfonivorans]
MCSKRPCVNEVPAIEDRAGASLPGFGPVLAAEFLGASGEDLAVFQSADRFAGVVGLARAPCLWAGRLWS